jgi:hypothetical protein
LVCHLRKKGINNYYIEMYNTWVNAASVLNEGIVKKDDPKFDPADALYRTIEDTYGGQQISYAEKITLQWAIQGIQTDNLKLDELKRSLLPSDTTVSFGELFGIENKSMEYFRLPQQVIPLSRNLPPSLVEFGGHRYHITDAPAEIEYNGDYYQRLSEYPHYNTKNNKYDPHLPRGRGNREDEESDCGNDCETCHH